ncbi:MAG: glycosyltransferase, partial [Myxococcota bacterium]
VGRFVAQKDYPTLMRAFALVRKERPARLLILGEARKPRRRERLLELAKQLGVADDVELPGHVRNPMAYMTRAAVFALSSSWEGLPGVLIEALACGCPVVATDSPGGSSEILAGGAYGRLVPIGDPEALAKALLATLDEPRQEARQKLRAAHFSVDASADSYLDALCSVARA